MRNAIAKASFVAVSVLLGLAGTAGARPSKPPKSGRDATPPSATISVPAAGATVSGSVSVSGTASDNVALAKVEVSVDGGAYAVATGLSVWSVTLDTSRYPDGSHTLTARATDTAGNSGTASMSVTFRNAPAPAPPPPDTTPPSLSIVSPAAGATLGGTVAVSGTASDTTAVARVDISTDGASYQLATGTTSWSYSLNTNAYADGTHSIVARATDTSGNSSSTSVSIMVKNAVPPPAGVAEQLITPEGATIQIYSDVTGYTAQQIYDLLKANALELDRVGPSLTIKVQTTYASSAATSASKTNGVYTSYRATIYLQAKAGTAFRDRPDYSMAHEYGHAWADYHLYLTKQGDWTSYLVARGIAGDPRVDTTYNWTKREMIADDYRMLFGSSAAVSGAAYLNPDVMDPRYVPGLRDFLLTAW